MCGCPSTGDRPPLPGSPAHLIPDSSTHLADTGAQNYVSTPVVMETESLLEPMASGGVPGPAAPPTHHAPPEDTPPDYTLPEDMPPNHAPPPPPQDMPLENGMAVERCMESHSQDGLQHESQVSSGGEMEGGAGPSSRLRPRPGRGWGKQLRK